MRDYRSVANEVAEEIKSGVLPPGTRLPPQRRFAFERGLAVSTASRVYGELARRGLVIGEVGRGTYVRAVSASEVSRTSEPADMPVDLQLSISLLPGQTALMTRALAGLAEEGALAAALGAFGPSGRPGAGEVISAFLASDAWRPDPRCLLTPGSGRQAIASALSALGKPGARVAVEPLTYPVIKSVAQRLGFELLPLKMADSGPDLAALRRLHAAHPLDGLYLQPILHNPLGQTMTAEAREELAAFLTEGDLFCVEDAVYAFLKETPPLAAFAPGRVIHVDSLSKRLAPGTGLGFIVAPPAMTERLASAMRAGSWVASSLSAALGLAWIESGIVGEIAAMRRADAAHRQKIAREILAGHSLQGDPVSYFLWLELPPPWRADSFTAAAAQRGVAITPGSAFAVAPGHAPNAVRIAISAPPLAELERGLELLRALLGADPNDVVVE